MGRRGEAWYSIPIVSQVKSAVQACKGDMKGALITQENFSKRCVLVSQVQSAVEAAVVSCEEAEKTQREFISPQVRANLYTINTAFPRVKGVIYEPYHSSVTEPGCPRVSPGRYYLGLHCSDRYHRWVGLWHCCITAGSWAAGFMSTYGGLIPAGSACAVLQSAGAAGISAGTAVAAGVVGGAGSAAAAVGAVEGVSLKAP